MALPDVEQLSSLTDAQCAALNACLVAAGFNDKALSETEALLPTIPFGQVREPIVRWTLRERTDAAATMLRLFQYKDSVPDAAVRTAFGDDLFVVARDSGLLSADAAEPGHWRSQWQVTPFRGLFVVCDPAWVDEHAVMGPSMTTDQLTRWLPTKIEGSALDVGCGAGSMALIAASRGARAVGTDINPRAIRLARFNARLNALQCEFLEGSLYEPVKDRKFDLIVAQPPFIPKPPTVDHVQILYGGSMGDELALRFVAEAPSVLATNGAGLFFFESAVRANDPLHGRLRAMMSRTNTNLMLYHVRAAPPEVAAVLFAATSSSDLGDGFLKAARQRWEHIRAAGIRETLMVMAIVHARDTSKSSQRGFGVSSIRANSLMGDEHTLLQMKRASELVASPDNVLMQAKLRVIDGARWIEERKSADLNDEPRRLLQFPKTALATERELSDATAALLGFIGESDSVGQGIARYAELCEATPEEVQEQALGFVREMLMGGVLRD